jgi:hypothetical protein
MTMRTRLVSMMLIIGTLAFLADAANGSVRETPGACKPVKVCGPVKVVPPVKVCEPVKQVPIPQPCEPVKTCDPVKVARSRYVYARTPFWHHLHRHNSETVYYTTPQDQPTPTDVKPLEPTQAPVNAPVPPTPDKA